MAVISTLERSPLAAEEAETPVKRPIRIPRHYKKPDSLIAETASSEAESESGLGMMVILALSWVAAAFVTLAALRLAPGF